MAKNPYRRTTRECAFADLRPELATAIREHAQQRELGDVEAQALICCETANERKEMSGLEKLKDRLLGLYDPDPVHYTGVVVTPTWLIWATSGERRGTATLSARLRDIEVRDFAALYGRLGVEDSGIDVYGLLGYFPQRASALIGLGQEPAAEKLVSVLKEAIQRVNNPQV